LSVPTQDIFDENLGNGSGRLTDNVSLIDNFEERCAISEYRNPLTVYCISRCFYRHIKCSPLRAYKKNDWFEIQLKAEEDWLSAQSINKPV